MKELFGEFIHSIYISDDKSIILFVVTGGYFYAYEATGDCCSTSWFESISNSAHLMGDKIIGIEEKTFITGCCDDPSLCDKCKEIVNADKCCIKLYGYTFKTSCGHSDIEFRNLSNGYYGGDCELLKSAEIIYPDGISKKRYLFNNDGTLLLKYADHLDTITLKEWTE